MKPSEAKRFNKLYQCHQRALKLQGKAPKTIEAYSRAVRRVSDHFDCFPDKLKPDQLEQHFADLVDSHSWSTQKALKMVVEECGIKKKSTSIPFATPSQPTCSNVV